MWFFYIKGRVARFFLTTILEHVVADGCTTQVHWVLLKSNLTKNKQTNKQNQTLRFIFKKRKEPFWGCFQTLHHLKGKASPSPSPSFSLFGRTKIEINELELWGQPWSGRSTSWSLIRSLQKFTRLSSGTGHNGACSRKSIGLRVSRPSFFFVLQLIKYLNLSELWWIQVSEITAPTPLL